MAKRHTYQQVPVIREDRICPLCHAKIEGTFQHFVRLYRGDKELQRELELLRCENCGIPFIDKKLLMKIKKAYQGYMIDFLKIGDRESLETIKKKIFQKKCELEIHSVPEKTEEKTLKETDCFQLLNKAHKDLVECPVCRSGLVDHYVFLRKDTDEIYTEICGRKCLHCGCIYVTEKQKKIIDDILKKSVNTENSDETDMKFNKNDKIGGRLSKEKHFICSIPSSKVMMIVEHVDGTEWKYIVCTDPKDCDSEKGIVYITSDLGRLLLGMLHSTTKIGVYQGVKMKLVYVLYPEKRDVKQQEKKTDIKITGGKQDSKDYLREKIYMRFVPSAVVMLIVKYAGYTERRYVVCTDKTDERQGVFHYKNPFARELLTMLYREEKNRKGNYRGIEIELLDEVYPEERLDKAFKRNIPVYLKIKSGGGLYNSLMQKSRELVDLLLYSPYTKRYEIIKATYDSMRGICYTDVALFREFIKKYGRPDVYIDLSGGDGEGRDWNDLRSESILKEYGYSVAESAGLSAHERQELLAELVDLEFITVSHIVHMLDFFIQSHKSQRYLSAQRKWQQDRKFISEYKVNPQRFLIAK